MREQVKQLKIIGQSLVNIISKIKHFDETVIIFYTSFHMYMVVYCFINYFFECN